MLKETKIPIIVLCGFLGSGKTTLLNNILRQENGVKIGVVINDFGAVNVDSMLVAKQSDDKIELSNGCICCEVGEGGLDSAIAQIAYKNSLIEAIIIEASGLAEPAELALSLSSTIRNDYAYYDSMVYVLDSANFAKTKIEHPQIEEHLKIADLIILNKEDLVSPKELQDLEEQVQKINPKATLVRATNSEVDAKLILGQDLAAERGSQLSLSSQLDKSGAMESEHDHDHSKHMHAHYQTLQFQTDQALDPEKLFAYLDAKADPVYRVKGWVYFGLKGLDQFYVLQAVGSRWKLYIDKSGRSFSPKTSLTLIGVNLDSQAEESKLNDCIDAAPDDVNAANMLDVLSYEEA